MRIETMKGIAKAFAITQAVTAPALMVIGHFTNKPILRNIGVVWCGLVTLETARTTANAIDVLHREIEGSIEILVE